jgi:hypothetical protein
MICPVSLQINPFSKVFSFIESDWGAERGVEANGVDVLESPALDSQCGSAWRERVRAHSLRLRSRGQDSAQLGGVRLAFELSPQLDQFGAISGEQVSTLHANGENSGRADNTRSISYYGSIATDPYYAGTSNKQSSTFQKRTMTNNCRAAPGAAFLPLRSVSDWSTSSFDHSNILRPTESLRLDESRPKHSRLLKTHFENTTRGSQWIANINGQICRRNQ